MLQSELDVERPTGGLSPHVQEERGLPDQEHRGRRPERPCESRVGLHTRHERHQDEAERQRQGHQKLVQRSEWRPSRSAGHRVLFFLFSVECHGSVFGVLLLLPQSRRRCNHSEWNTVGGTRISRACFFGAGPLDSRGD